MSDPSRDQPARPAGRTRREVLAVGAVAAAGAVGVVSLSGCGSSPGTAGPPGSGAGSSSTGTSSSASSGGGGGLVTLADVPVGGAVSAKGPSGPAIVAQPTAGQVVAFSARCTHQGCTVAPAGDKLDCPCHGSVYDAFTGQVLHGPAPAPLAPLKVTVQGGEVVVSA